MQIRIRATGQVMYEGEFREYIKSTDGASWDVTTTDVLEALGADVVFEGPQATGGTVYQYSQAQGVEQVDGKWYTKYVLGPIFTDGETTAAEQEAAYKAQKDTEQAKNVRASRDTKLAECDWVVVKALETGGPVPADWAAYRQALRDLPSQNDFPWGVTWPVLG